MEVVIKGILETIQLIQTTGGSLARFGDGEIDIITGKSIPYQDYDVTLAQKLKNILQVPSSSNFFIGIPDVFQNLERYNSSAQYFWKSHLYLYQDFYNAELTSPWYVTTFVSRPYIDLAHKEGVEDTFRSIKNLWEDRDLLIIEGETTRSGVGNDLFHNARSISRIICPSRNSYSYYEEILSCAKIYGENKLILIMLGPTAKILAYELSQKNYQAIDIGHIDSEYEWFQMKANYKVKLHHKHTAEYNYDKDIIFEQDNNYDQSIITKIGLT